MTTYNCEFIMPTTKLQIGYHISKKQQEMSLKPPIQFRDKPKTSQHKMIIFLFEMAPRAFNKV